MAVVAELIRSEADGSISFGNHSLAEKAKLEDFSHAGDVYKVKTYKTLTKLEKNGMFLYESEPGTSVNSFNETDKGVSFTVDGDNDAQITVGLAENEEYEVTVAGKSIGKLTSNLSGKINLSLELADKGEVKVVISK
ncbi:MAG: endosialidase [Lachnospiraceae bacterium]|nr:endosialidase [Lachnospiraceae bacterium]